MFIVSPIFLNYSASSWNPKQRILQLMLCPSPSGPSWRFFSALECCSYAGHGHPFSCLRKAPVICPGRPQSCHAPTVEYAPLKMVAVPSWWRFRNDQEKDDAENWSLSVVSPCHVFHLSIYFECTPSDATRGLTLRLFCVYSEAWFPSPTQPSMARNTQGHTHSGPDVGPINS